MNPNLKFALKLIKNEFINRDQENRDTVVQEMEILGSLKHKNIIGAVDQGFDGTISKPSGKVLKSLPFIIMEYVPGGILFDFCKNIGGFGEETGKLFLHQLLDTLEYLESKEIAHRDLKLENILVDEDCNLKIADFGFATSYAERINFGFATYKK